MPSVRQFLAVFRKHYPYHYSGENGNVEVRVSYFSSLLKARWKKNRRAFVASFKGPKTWNLNYGTESARSMSHWSWKIGYIISNLFYHRSQVLRLFTKLFRSDRRYSSYQNCARYFRTELFIHWYYSTRSYSLAYISYLYFRCRYLQILWAKYIVSDWRDGRPSKNENKYIVLASHWIFVRFNQCSYLFSSSRNYRKWIYVWLLNNKHSYFDNALPMV